MPRYNLIALTNAVEGQHEAFNDWYDNVHVADVLRIPGVTAAQRYRLSDTQFREGNHQWGYMAVYEIEGDDLSGTLNALRAASGTDAMPLSDALKDERMVWVYEPIQDRWTADA